MSETSIIKQSESPEKIVQMQLDYYNANDLEMFAGIYSEDVEIYDLPEGTLRFKGREALRARYAVSFSLHTKARVEKRLVAGNKVIDHEYFIRDGMSEEGHVIAIYEVNGALISRVWFLKP